MNAFLQGFKVPAKLYWDASYEKILESQHYLSDLRVQNWLHNSFPKWTWWFLVFWSILPLFIWWKYIDRTRFLEISLFGLIVSISAGILDALGVAFLLWCYPYALVPALPNFFPIDYVVIPVCFMLIYQKYSGWKEFLTAVTVIASILSLILDPIMVWMNIYQPLSWQYIYSVPVFIFMVGFGKLVTMIITGQDLRYRKGY